MMIDFLDPGAWTALTQVLMADLVLAGDNAIVVGMASSGLPPALRRKAIMLGLAIATALRVVFSLVAIKLLSVIGLTLAGGILLLWVAWKMGRELVGGSAAGHAPTKLAKTMRAALIQIAVADVSMSLDNVLAVAGAAREYPLVLISGLIMSVALAGLASSLIARLLVKHRWIAYIGLAMVAGIAARMIWDGAHEVMPLVTPG